MATEMENWQKIKDLSEAVSTQSKIANRYWIALAVYSVTYVSNFWDWHSIITNKRELNLPFGLGSADIVTYSVVSFFVLFALFVAFCVSHINEQLASQFFHKEKEKISGSDKQKEEEYNNFYDFIRVPTFGRVGPVAIFLRDRFKMPRVAGCYFVVLKILATFIYVFVPGYIVCDSYYKVFKLNALVGVNNFDRLKIPLMLCYGIGWTIFIVTMFQYVIVSLSAVKKVFRKSQ